MIGGAQAFAEAGDGLGLVEREPRSRAPDLYDEKPDRVGPEVDGGQPANVRDRKDVGASARR